MEKIFDCQLQNTTTTISFSHTIEEVIDEINSFHQKKLFIADENTVKFISHQDNVVLLSCGESAKNIDSVINIVKEAKLRGFNRDDTFVAVGGGVICDITAFAASLYMRGCNVVLIPTTLLAQVDASVGGKTGVDFENSKNFIGTFYPATHVYISVDTLSSLCDKEFKNGLGEVLKHALLSSNQDLYHFLLSEKNKILQREKHVLLDMIYQSLEVKISYIERDPKEMLGIRDALNLGHTFAHALESVGNLTQFSHGEAVAWGVVKSLIVGQHIGLIDKTFASTYIRLFDEYEFDVTHRVTDIPLFLASLKQDKKIRNNLVRFIIMKGQGEPLLLPLEKEVIIPFL